MARSKKSDIQQQLPKQSTFNNLEAKLARQREIERCERGEIKGDEDAADE
jgi:hypothetical protein